MCDVCQAEGLNWTFLNGKRTAIRNAKLYRVYMGRVAFVKLCHLHDIQLFVLGEQRFLKEHIYLAKTLSENRVDYAS